MPPAGFEPTMSMQMAADLRFRQRGDCERYSPNNSEP